ncbi:S41 family peptidase [Clostridium oryzae]|uniref:Carboxy-terminal processing protease CtpA n=1 Tax=Clostridium oryzae TaxID=1450648 RepID=A0A1V4IYG2_9CLOT|nr:S41 family peptidase [Clostridium oryzae]OPJ65108.1 carboxy-terminal processing protease CtpA precursor [Clostridium oryzae]
MDIKEHKEVEMEKDHFNDDDRGNFIRKSKRNKIVIVVIILLISNIASLYLGAYASIPLGNKVIVSKKDYQKLKRVEGIMASNSDLYKTFNEYPDVLKFKQLFQINDILHKYYYKNIDEDKLVEGAIKGMAASLKDPYTVYMNTKEFKDFSTETGGTYVGVGLQVAAKNNKITVISIFDGSPAQKAGIKAGDVITAVNGTTVTGNELEKAVTMMKGKKGKQITLTIDRKGKGKVTVKVVAAKVQITTVKGRMVSKNIGLIELSMFDENSDEQFIAKAKELKAKGMKGIILDLRENPGGRLDTCVNIVSQFIDKGKLIVSTKDKNGTEERDTAVKGQLLKGMPMVALIDGNSASASEITSGVIRDYKVGTLIGTRTFGKGVVQIVLQTPGSTALKVTISKYYTPSGENIDKIGIKPNITIQYPKEFKAEDLNTDKDPQFKKAIQVINDKLK